METGLQGRGGHIWDVITWMYTGKIFLVWFRELKVESFGWPLLESFDLFGEEILQMFHGGHLGHFEHIRRFGPFWKLGYFRTHLV